MKRTTIHISAALALLLGLAACTQDEAGLLPEGAEGTPIVFTATGLNPTATATAGTRATVDGNWEGVETVAVLINGEVKDYDVNPSATDNTSATLTSTDPHYWSNYDNIAVTAWWPYTAGETTPPVVKVAENQHNLTDYQNSDFISAENQTVEFGSPTLRFTHRTARITVALTDYTEGLVSVKLTDLSTENGNPAEIIPYDKGNDTYTALVAPQTVAAGTTFVTCTFDNGKDFVYKMQNDAEWKAGEEYTYTVSLAAANDLGYTVSADGKTYEVYNANGLLAWNEAARNDLSINCTLTADIDLTGIEWTPIGTYSYNQYIGTFDGKDHTITGLTITGSGIYAGLFGCLGSGGKVMNVKLEGVQIESDNGMSNAGGVAGWSDGTVENCSASGSVIGRGEYSIVGGVVGYQSGGSITGCSSSATVNAGSVAGGVAGSTQSATLTGCYATGDVTLESNNPNDNFAGGVVGVSGSSSTLIACYAWGSVTGSGSGTIYVGGVTGTNVIGTLTACYHAKGDVSCPDGTTGGVTGRNTKYYNEAVVTACYWGSNPDAGIGYNQAGTGETTKVDGTVTWQTAVDAMNAALNGTGWRYELTGELPTLKKEE